MEALIQLLIQDTLFILVVLIARAALIGRVQYRHLMLLWYIALARLLFPFPIRLPVKSLVASSNQGTFVPHETLAHSLTQSGASWLATQSGHVLFFIWIAGILIALIINLASHLCWLHTHPKIGLVDDPELCAWANSFGHRHRRASMVRIKTFCSLFTRNVHPIPAVYPQQHATRSPALIKLIWTDNLKSPVTYGFAFPTILLPLSVAGLDAQQKRHIIDHELTHIHRLDPFFKLLSTLACCLLWFNPLVWIMRTLADRDIELTCDECIACFLVPSYKRSYASLLLSFACTSHDMGNMNVVAFSSGTASFLSMRIKALQRMSRQMDLTSLAKCLAAIPLALVLSTTGIASTDNPWVIRSGAGSITLPKSWHERVAVSTARTANGTDFVEIYPLGKKENPLVAFGKTSEHLEAKVSNVTLVAITSRNGELYALWGFDYSDSVSELPKWDSSIPMVNAWQLSTGDNPDMDSLEFLQREVVPTFRPA